ncbi:MAG: DUF4411 family protein [Anaerolineaceae bacterium]|nr:DUF4411 family protein [Anaerolineaceae bacterium]
MNNNLFLIDSNTLITPYRQYYPFDFAVSFWNQMKFHIENGNIVILDLVRDEILCGEDQLSQWLEAIKIKKYIDHREEDILRKYAEVMQYVNSCGFYNDTAFTMWANDKVADPWLVSVAQVRNLSLVTQETNTYVLNKSNPTKRIRIPDVANHFGVKVISLFDMMRLLSFSL